MVNIKIESIIVDQPLHPPGDRKIRDKLAPIR